MSQISAGQVKELRERSGCGMMECKKALVDSEGNMDKALDLLRERGLAKAVKKAGRIASEGIVESYIHLGGKIGVLLEVNCETDFVAKTVGFKTLAHDIALHIAAAKPTYITKEEVNPEEIEHEKEINRAMALNDPKPKPAEVVEKMLVGRIDKFYKEICLLEQLFVKDTSLTVTKVLENAGKDLGAKITVKRFARFEMGEGLQKRECNFAEEIAAATRK